MDKNAERKAVLPLFIFFMLINGFCTISKSWLTKQGVDPVVLGFGNIILFILSLITFLIQKNAIKTGNPQKFVRSVMMSTLLKLIVVGIAVVVYVKWAGAGKSIYGVIGAMVLYLVYTFMEVRIVQQLNRGNGSSE